MLTPSKHVFDGMFRAEAMVEIFSDQHTVQRMLDFEAALARAAARVGLVRDDAAHAIVKHCSVAAFDLEALGRCARDSGNLAIPMVKQLTALVRAGNAEAAGYVHWGATSQDAIDTGLMLQLRDALRWFDLQIEQIMETLAALVSEHRATLQVGRTWMQQAVPITFGWKLATYLDVMLRHAERLQEIKARVLVVQFGGAAGTLASLGPQGQALAEALGQELGLAVPAIPWHTSRDRVAEVATILGLLAGTLGKMARDISLAMQTEVGELAEANAGGSSTMPHKRNPVASAVALSCVLRVPGLVGTMLTAMLQEHERGLGGWHAEWETLPEICMLTAGSLHAMSDALSSLQVDKAAMRANVETTRGLIMAEAVSMELARSVGRERAHAVVEQASRASIRAGIELKQALVAMEEVNEHIDEKRLSELLEPANYLGSSDAMISNVLRRFEGRARPTKETGPYAIPAQ